MTDEKYLLNRTFRMVEDKEGWNHYAVWCMGESNTGDKDLDKAIEELYRANEEVHRIANKLALRYDLDPSGGW